MSTNDQVSLLVSGASGIAPTRQEFGEALAAVCLDLAQQLQGDAEGASHDITIEVVNAASESDAVEVGRSRRPQQPLQGRDLRQRPELGARARGDRHDRRRVRPVRRRRLDERRPGLHRGRPRPPREDVDLTPRATSLVIDLKVGDATATILTNDLTHDYVHENSAYSS